jgi:hypothetical protein
MDAFLRDEKVDLVCAIDLTKKEMVSQMSFFFPSKSELFVFLGVQDGRRRLLSDSVVAHPVLSC